MKKIKLKSIGKDEILTRDELKQIMGGVDGSTNCGENEVYDVFTGCRCKPGYYFSAPYGKCIQGTGSGPSDPNPKITACLGKREFDNCSWTYQGSYYTGTCRYRMASELYCADTIYV